MNRQVHGPNARPILEVEAPHEPAGILLSPLHGARKLGKNMVVVSRCARESFRHKLLHKLPVDGLPTLWQHAANMSAGETKLSFTRAAAKAAACQHFLSVTRSFPEDFVERRDVLPAGGKGALHSQFEED